MNVACLDLEGVLLPEVWIAFADAAGIPELRKTTRDEPDYDKLMRYRLEVLAEHGMTLPDIQAVAAKVDPLPGAKEFLDALEKEISVIIVSDTFEQFAAPLMAKLGNPTIFCNSLVTDETGKIIDYKMRCEQSKLTTIKALQSCGMEPICVGDSHNDLGMILNGKTGFLFNTTEAIKQEYPQVPAFDNYDDLLEAIKAAR
ncbi:MAG: bifunctional phosphoserine phosphatase/homoserine phosphotransferase ThrH [Coriobacteriia bacterium]|nr:bifunctional phosphoserine phosphatase/homoserine phosphotransferase ThrH [Coriobacteriia bacterium]